MKRINFKITVAIILFTTTILKAQDATNDATWEETKKFIIENISHLNHHKIKLVNGKKVDEWDYTFTLKNEKIKSYSNYYDGGNFYEADIKNLVSVILNRRLEDNEFYYFLKFLEKTVSYEDSEFKLKRTYISLDLNSEMIHEEGGNVKWRYTSDFKESDIMIKRLLKAFQHLAYLATEKRKKSKF